MAPKRPEIFGPDVITVRIGINSDTWVRIRVAAAGERTTASAIVELALREWLASRDRSGGTGDVA
jgi:hypothetical protein